MGSEPKKWGKSPFWGLTEEYDPDWILTEEQKILRTKLIELCRTKIRPRSIQCDKTYEFPRKSLEDLSELGLLGLIIPKIFGGLGQNHVGASMVVETIARYGCASTAMVYTMHIGACATLLLRYHKDKNIQNLLRRLDKDKLIGTLSYSDPATGGHIWFPLSSKLQKIDDDTIKILKYGSWATSAGHADFYTIQTISPDANGDYSNLSCFLIYKDEVRASTDDWSALGMHGNQSGPMIVEGKFPMNRMIGPAGDGQLSNDECVDPFFLLLSAACWNGISMACMDLAKKHVTRKAHADVGMRVCDYPTIQDYFGDCLSNTTINRTNAFALSQVLDQESNNNDWSLHEDLTFAPRLKYLQWLWMAKLTSSKNVTEVSDTMLHACGGSGYKTDLGIERLLRDGKAGWVMGPSNEVLRQFIGKSSLMGYDSLDFWEQKCNTRSLHHELGKMKMSEKKILAQKILEEVSREEAGNCRKHTFQDSDFENPFNTAPPAYNPKAIITKDGVSHSPSLNPTNWTFLKLLSRRDFGSNMCAFIFSLPSNTDYTGCLPGQYIQIQVSINGRMHERFFSPVSRPDDFGNIELVLKFESQGLMSKFFKSLNPGDSIQFLGPCGGFEYEPNKLEELTLIAAGGGITPGLQLIRCIMNNPSDHTKINLIYYSDSYDDILYREELDNYAAQDSRLRIIHTLGEVPEDWEGDEGFINTELLDKYVTKPNGIKHKIVMCGGPTMTISALHSFNSLDFPPEIIFIYGQFGTEQIRTVYGRNVKLSGHNCENIV